MNKVKLSIYKGKNATVVSNIETKLEMLGNTLVLYYRINGVGNWRTAYEMHPSGECRTFNGRGKQHTGDLHLHS